MLILSHAQGFRINLHQFGQRVHKTAADGYGTAHRDIVLGEFFPSHLGGGIDGRAVLTHGEYFHTFGESHLTDEILCLAPGGAIADGNYLDTKLFGHVGYLGDGLYFLGHGGMRENDIMGQQIALGIQAHQLAAGTETRVDGHHPFLPYRRGQQQLSQIIAENLDAFHIGLFLGFPTHFSGNGRIQQPFPSIVYGFSDLRAGFPAGITLGLTIVVIKLIAALFPVGINLHFQETFLLGAQHGQ